jgi:hypothetical protein
MSEAAEESVQYINSKDDFASKYGWSGMSIGDAISRDLYSGARVFNTYAALLGLSDSELVNDPEYWANWKGGFALSGIHTGIMRFATEGYNAYREIPVHAALIETATMNRELDKKDRAANVEFARQAMRNRTNETLEVLDWMERNDSRRKDPMFTQEDYDEKKRAAQRIGQIANDRVIRAKFEAMGLVYGTEEYANAVADRYNLEEQRRQNKAEKQDKNNDILGFIHSKEYQDEADAIVEAQFNADFESTIGEQTAAIEAGNKAVAEEIKRANAAGEDTSTSDFKKHLQNIRKDAQEQTIQQNRLDYREATLNASHIAHKLRALINLKA